MTTYEGPILGSSIQGGTRDLGQLANEFQEVVVRWINDLAKIGVTEGGLWRRPFTSQYEDAVALVSGWMREAGMETRLDEVGNLIGRVEGSRPGGRAVMVGSHIDTVRGGGNYDGVLGVVGGIAAVSHLIRTLGRPAVPLEVVAFIGEEGSRYAGGFLGSKWMAGALDAAELSKTDADGISMGDAAALLGYSPDPDRCRPRDDVDYYLELHIEQGPVLEAAGCPIGVVTSIVGMRQAVVTVTGRADHAGTTPMNMRKDALAAAVRMIDRMGDLARASEESVRFTVGRMDVKPGAANVVPEEASFSVDLRDVSSERLTSLSSAFRSICNTIAAEAGVTVCWRDALHTEPVLCDGALRDLLASSARRLGVDPIDIVSGAGHDAVMASRFAKVGMVFVPSVDGRSHCREEFTEPHHCWLGSAVLAEALREIAYNTNG